MEETGLKQEVDRKNRKREYMIVWRQSRPKGRQSEYQKNKKSVDVQFKIASDIRTRLYIGLKAVGTGKVGCVVKNIGCSIEELKAHIEEQFKPGMSWDNWSRHGWHIDHIKPLSSFDLTEESQLIEACHYTNLQPLWAEENKKKFTNVLNSPL